MDQVLILSGEFIVLCIGLPPLSLASIARAASLQHASSKASFVSGPQHFPSPRPLDVLTIQSAGISATAWTHTLNFLPIDP